METTYTIQLPVAPAYFSSGAPKTALQTSFETLLNPESSAPRDAVKALNEFKRSLHGAIDRLADTLNKLESDDEAVAWSALRWYVDGAGASGPAASLLEKAFVQGAKCMTIVDYGPTA